MQPFTQHKMTIEQWIAVEDNPIQRNTESHARKARNRHLKIGNATHARVAAARMPDGTLYKLDGHTRAYLWDEGTLTPPNGKVYVDVYQVENQDQLEGLYKTFDNTAAAEGSADKLAGAYRKYGLIPQSSLIGKGAVTTAIFMIVGGGKNFDIYTDIRRFMPILELLDRENFKARSFPTGILMAAIVTAHTDGEAALEFWRRYHNDLGSKSGKERDAVQALTETVEGMRARGVVSAGRSMHFDLAGRALSAYNAYKEARWYTTGLRLTDFRAYADKALK